MSKFGNWSEVSPLGDLLVRNAQLYPDRDALVFPDSRCTFNTLLDQALEVATGLLALGVRPGEHVGLLTTNSIEYVAAFYGIGLMGAVAVPINVRHKAAELGYIINNAELVALCTTADTGAYVDFSEVLRLALPSLKDAPLSSELSLPEAPRLRHAILLRGQDRQGFMDRTEFDRLAATVESDRVHQLRRQVMLRDTAIIIYTSGTTAHPKGCMLSHEALTRGPVERARFRFASGGHDVHWGAGPLFHIGSLAPMIGALGAGCTYVTDLYFDPVRAVALIERERVTTVWPWFPAIVLALLEQARFDGKCLPALRSIVLIAASTVVERVQNHFPGVEILQGCGMTETAGIFGLTAPEDSATERATTQGKAYPGIEIRLLDPETGADVPLGEVGEILVRGYCLMTGYYKDPVKTAATIDADGWLHTGDLYRQTMDGNLFFNGRLKDMLKVGGENVAAIEVEAFLCEHPAVKLAEVVGKPDPRLDEVPVAFVELHPGASLTAQELIDFCKNRIANYKIPRAVYFLAAEDWPMSATKVDKRGLRARLDSL
ncbi:MAG: AMP-binding protein [Pseudomonadota bacterium]